MDHHATSENEQEDNPMDFDTLLPHVGEFGRYQKCLLWFICLPACFPSGINALNQLFMANVPDHWCLIPELANLTAEDRLAIAIPHTSKSHSHCSRFKINWTEYLLDNSMEISNEIEGCLDGWEYNTTDIYSSIVIDYNLVCNRDIYPSLGLLAINVGRVIGTYMFGRLNDKVGRRNTFFLCLTTLLFGGLLTSTARNFWWWAGSRLIVGLTIPSIFQIPAIFSIEMVGPNYRSFVTMMTSLYSTLGILILACAAYFIRDWIILSYVTSLPFIFYYAYFWFLPESPRWLLAKGRYQEAIEVLETFVKVNKKQIPVHIQHQLQNGLMERNPRLNKYGIGVVSLFRTPNMRLKTFLISLNWFAVEMVYTGLSYYSPALGNDQYLSFTLSFVVEIPCFLFGRIIVDKCGRRWPMTLSMGIGGTCCIATVLLPEDAVLGTLILYLIGKFSVSVAYFIIYLFAGELYPTEVRGIGIATSAYIASLGILIIPFITYLGTENLVLPLVIMGFISIVGGIVTLRLPETQHCPLPQTLEEGEAFGAEFTFYDCSSCNCRHTSSSPITSEIREEDSLID